MVGSFIRILHYAADIRIERVLLYVAQISDEKERRKNVLWTMRLVTLTENIEIFAVDHPFYCLLIKFTKKVSKKIIIHVNCFVWKECHRQ